MTKRDHVSTFFSLLLFGISFSSDEFVRIEIKVELSTGLAKISALVNVQDAEDAYVDIILLHGEKFTSNTWTEAGTFRALSNAGYRVIAVDLPGYGESTSVENIELVKPDEFLYNLIKTLRLKNPVLISPSMSGKYSIPFIISYPNILSGFVPIAPLFPRKFVISNVPSNITFITLVVWGSKDSRGRKRSEELLKLKNSVSMEMVDSSHACYLDRPEYFNQELLRFVDKISRLTLPQGGLVNS